MKLLTAGTEDVSNLPPPKTKTWNVFWQRADLKWRRYEPEPEVGSLDEFLQLVDDDAHACFWG
jgi:hypothetical protein